MALQLSRKASPVSSLSASVAIAGRSTQQGAACVCPCGNLRAQAPPSSSLRQCLIVRDATSSGFGGSQWAKRKSPSRTQSCRLQLLRSRTVEPGLSRGHFHVVGCQDKSASAKTSQLASVLLEKTNLEQVGCNKVTRRQLASIALFTAVLVGSPESIRAEESLLSAPSQTTSEGSESGDELLESENIKVSGGSRKTGLESDPTLRRYRAEDFSINVPRSYTNVTDEDDNPRSTLTMEQKAANRPFAARFASPDQTETVTVVIRDASTMRLSFLQTKDISDLGSIDKAAGLLLPPGAKVLKSRVVSQEVERGQELEKVVKSIPLEIDTKLVRNYYQYEFYARGQVVALTAGAQQGKVYVVGATVPAKKYKELAKQMRAIVASFELR